MARKAAESEIRYTSKVAGQELWAMANQYFISYEYSVSKPALLAQALIAVGFQDTRSKIYQAF